MRFALVFLILLVAIFATAQELRKEQGSNGSLFLTTRVDGVVVVSKSRTGADLVQVTLLKPTYSQDLLRRQIALLGRELKSEPRGVDVGFVRSVDSDPDSAMLRATFAVDGLIDRTNGTFRLRPIARGFAIAAPPDEIGALMIQFQHETPGPNALRSCSPPEPGCSGAMLEGRAEGPEIGVEYRLKYLSHNPADIDLPDTPRTAEARKAAAPPKSPTDWTLVVLVVVGAAAAGALVYSLLLGSRRPRNPPASGTPRRSPRASGGASGGGSGGVSGRRRPSSRVKFCPSLT